MSTETLHRETREVILKNIENRDRRFRLFQGVFVVLIFLALIGLLWVQEATLNNVKKELAQQQQTVGQIKNNTKQQLDTINRHLDCIVVYFGQQNRAALTIQDINKCTLQNSTGVQQFFAPTAANPNQTSTTNPATVKPQSSTKPANPSSTGPTAPSKSPSPSSTTVPSGSGGSTLPTQPSPVTVLGIPLCIPFTGVCAR